MIAGSSPKETGRAFALPEMSKPAFAQPSVNSQFVINTTAKPAIRTM